jgi:endonuclease/exonuclease/phosphatase family metal-dependent hydrolase
MTTLRIATLNCLNLALPGRRFYDGVDPYTADEYIAKTQWLAAMLDRLAADVVLLQEVFHEQALSDVVRQTAGGARAWSLAAPLAGQDNGKPRLAVAWRQPWRPSLQSIADFPAGCAVDVPEAGTHASFSRPLLRAELPLPGPGGGRALTLFNVHLKSRRPDFATDEDPADQRLAARAQLRSLIRRGAEAAALRCILEQAWAEMPAPLIVAGDFNDDIGAVTTRIVSDAPAAPDGGGESPFRLYDAFDVEQRLAPAGRRSHAPVTTLGDAGGERIDHVLLSRHFLPGAEGAVGAVAAVDVFGDHLLERRRRADGGARFERVYADHAAVCITLELAAGAS